MDFLTERSNIAAKKTVVNRGGAGIFAWQIGLAMAGSSYHEVHTGVLSLLRQVRKWNLDEQQCLSCTLRFTVSLFHTPVQRLTLYSVSPLQKLYNVSPCTVFHLCTVSPPRTVSHPSSLYNASPWLCRFHPCRASHPATFKRLARMPGRHKWRGVYAEENAFAICPDMRWPPWLHMIPDMGYTPGLG